MVGKEARPERTAVVIPVTDADERRRPLLVSGLLLGVSTLAIAFVTAVSSWSGGEVSVLVGPFSSDRVVAAAVVVALASLAAGLCLVPVSGWWLMLLIPARLIAIVAAALAAFVMLLTSSRGCAPSAAMNRPPTATPTATPTPAPPTWEDDRTVVEQLAAVSLAAASGPVRDTDGDTFDPTTMTASSVVCGDGAARSSLSLEFQSADNAASVEAILSAWDDAGYESDRAMQEDMRYREVLPVEQMTIRDSTTIDGLIHMQLTSRCAALERTAD